MFSPQTDPAHRSVIKLEFLRTDGSSSSIVVAVGQVLMLTDRWSAVLSQELPSSVLERSADARTLSCLPCLVLVLPLPLPSSSLTYEGLFHPGFLTPIYWPGL